VLKFHKMNDHLLTQSASSPRSKTGEPSNIIVNAGMNIVVSKSDESARAKWEDSPSYGDEEGALAGMDLCTCSDDEFQLHKYLCYPTDRQ